MNKAIDLVSGILILGMILGAFLLFGVAIGRLVYDTDDSNKCQTAIQRYYFAPPGSVEELEWNERIPVDCELFDETR